jgi:hypothetical protein
VLLREQFLTGKKKDPTLQAQGRLGGLIAHSRHGGKAMTEKARSTFLERFANEIRSEQPGLEQADPREFAKRVDLRRRAHMARLRLRHAQVRNRDKATSTPAPPENAGEGAV